MLVFEDPALCDVLSLAGDYLEDRSRWSRWQAGASDTEGCTMLRLPRPLTSQVDLLHLQCPIVCLIDALKNAGFAPQSSTTLHSPESPLVYDDRKLSSGRFYLQCVLNIPMLHSRGNGTFSSGEIQVCFRP